MIVETPLGRLTLPQSQAASPGQPVTVLIRPEAARLAEECPGEGDVVIEGTVSACSFRGSYSRLVMVHQTGLELIFELVWEASRAPGPGEPVRLDLRLDAMSFLKEESDDQTAVG
jgi:ABC-type Fe3+/spermidine/putrescine transport system ATPase subunit